MVDFIEAELAEPPVGDIADIGLDLVGRQPLDIAGAEGEVDKGVLMDDDLAAGRIELLTEFLRPDFRVLVNEGLEQLDDGVAMQALVADGPGDDLPHALHLAGAREVEQDGEAGEQLQPLGEGAKDGEGLRNLRFVVDIELLHIVVFVLHLLVMEEGGIFRLGHADGVQEMRIGGDMHRLHIREGGEHHLHLGRLEDAGVMAHVAVVDLDIRLGEEAENLRQQMPLRVREGVVPVLHVIGERHFFGQPVNLLLLQPGVVAPGIGEGFVDRLGIEQGHDGYLFFT
mgnify:CR=1 FL=1